MTIIGLVLAALAALIHVYIFTLESLNWLSAKTRAIFRSGTVEETMQTKLLAFNQGFYNLFLALVVVVGIVCVALGISVVGFTLVCAGTGCMLAASVVLLISSPKYFRAALVQGTAPLLTILALAIALAS